MKKQSIILRILKALKMPRLFDPEIVWKFAPKDVLSPLKIECKLRASQTNSFANIYISKWRLHIGISWLSLGLNGTFGNAHGKATTSPVSELKNP